MKLEPATVSLADIRKSAYEELAKFLLLAVFGEGYGSKFDGADNMLLGITEKSEAEVGEILKAVVN